MAKKTIILSISLFLNVLFIATAILFFGIARNYRAFTFFNLNDEPSSYNAFLISLPAENTEIVFGTAEFSLRRGARATIQLSTILDNGLQANHVIQPLFDRSIVSVEQTGFGISIRALAVGETVLQTFCLAYGFRDVARIYVYD